MEIKIFAFNAPRNDCGPRLIRGESGPPLGRAVTLQPRFGAEVVCLRKLKTPVRI